MRNYEVTFIVDPVLSNDEIKTTAQNYIDHLKRQDCNVIHSEDLGLRQLAYPIKKRTSGVYFSVEFQVESGDFIQQLELALRRDERIIRFLTVKLDKYGVKFNEDKRKGLIGKKKKRSEDESQEERAPRTRQTVKTAVPVEAVVATEVPAVEEKVETKVEPSPDVEDSKPEEAAVPEANATGGEEE